jgi:bla regulator protein BlaR1
MTKNGRNDKTIKQSQMNYLYELLSENLLYALGWTVIHSIWQGILIAVLLAFVLLSMEKKTARTRYAVANFGLFALLLTSIITFCLLYQKAPAMSLEEAFLVETSVQSEVNFWQNFTNYFNQNLPLIVSVWLMGVVFFILKMLGGLLYIQHLKNNQNKPFNNFWQQKMKGIAQQIPLKKSVALLESALVKVPMVVGYLKPVILMPIGAINALSEEQVEAILAHELAHIYRNDYLLNILQTFVETLFYFHPAAWWISGNIRLERENCCDDLAVKLCGNPLHYAKALLSLQEMHAGAPALAMAFSSQKNQLLHRVQRILNQPQNKSNIMEKLMATTLFVVLMIMISFGANMPMANILTGKNFSNNIEIEVEKLEGLNVFETDNGRTIIATFIKKDSIPSKSTNRSTYTKTVDGVESKISLVNGEIENVTIDGKNITKADFKKYEKQIKDLKSSMQNASIPPPPPPAPLVPNGAIPPPPPPPAPNRDNAPGFGFTQKSKTIVTKKDDNGNTIITIETDENNEPMTIKIEELVNGKQIIKINDEAIELLSKNDRFIIKEIENGQPNIFFFDDNKNRVFKFDDGFPKSTLSEYFAFENGKNLEGLANNFNLESISKDDFPEGLLRLKGNVTFPILDKDSPTNLEYQRWQKRFEIETEERKRDGKFSQKWLRQKQMEENEWQKKNQEETAERFKKQRLEEGEVHRFELLPSPKILYLDELQHLNKLNESILFKDLQNELILDGLIQKGERFEFELNETNFKINGKKQSQKQLRKYLKLLEKQEKKRLKLKSKLS